MGPKDRLLDEALSWGATSVSPLTAIQGTARAVLCLSYGSKGSTLGRSSLFGSNGLQIWPTETIDPGQQ